MRVVRHEARVDLLLYAVEVRTQVACRQSGDPKIPLPLIEHIGRRAKHQHPVHRRSAAGRAALQQRDGRVNRGAHRLVGEESGNQVAFQLVEVGRVQVFALLEDDHLPAGLREAAGGNRAPGATADHDDVRLQSHLAGQ